MFRTLTARLTAVLAPLTVLVGILAPMPAAAQTAAGNDVPAIAVAPEVARNLVRCTDWDPADPYQTVWLDISTGTLFGDQDRNGLLDGDDCRWK